MTVNCKTDSIKTITCYVLLEQPTFGAFSAACINTCMLHWAKPADIFLTQSPRLDRKSIIILINLLYLQTRVKKIGKLILPCLEAHFGDLIAFQPMAISSQEWQADAIQPTGSSGMKGSSRNTRGTVQPGSNYEAVEQIYWCQTASVQLAQLTSDNATLESNCSCSRAEYFCFTAKCSFAGNLLCDTHVSTAWMEVEFIQVLGSAVNPSGT